MKFLSPVLAKFSSVPGNVQKATQALWGKFNNLSKTERRFLIVAILVLSALFVDSGIVRPLRANMEALNQKIKETEKKVMRDLKSASQKPDLEKIYAKLQQDISDSRVSDEEIRSSMLHDIEQFAGSDQIYLSEVKPQVSTETTEFKQFSVRMVMECHAEELMRFFSELMKTHKLYTIDSFRITPHPEDVHKIKATVTVGRVVLRT